jgi:hypothetical protein
MADRLISRKKRLHQTPAVDVMAEDGYSHALRRSREARDHLQDLLERSDQKAGFVVTGISFLGVFLEQGQFARWPTLIALVCYGLAFILVCVTAFPRKWGWYRPVDVETLRKRHLQERFDHELKQSCRQESDLRAIYRLKNICLMVGFVFLIGGMMATLWAVLQKYA